MITIVKHGRDVTKECAKIRIPIKDRAFMLGAIPEDVPVDFDDIFDSLKPHLCPDVIFLVWDIYLNDFNRQFESNFKKNMDRYGFT